MEKRSLGNPVGMLVVGMLVGLRTARLHFGRDLTDAGFRSTYLKTSTRLDGRKGRSAWLAERGTD